MIGRKDLADAYLSRIQALGVGVSEAKTHISKDMFEFAKRLFLFGDEISPFPVSSIIKNLEQYPLLVASLMGEERKGLLSIGGIPESIRTLYSTLCYPQKFCKGIKRKSEICRQGTLILQGRVAPTDLITEVCRDGDLVLRG